MATDPPDRLEPLNDDLTDWLDGGPREVPGRTRSHGNPIGTPALDVLLGTRLHDLARLAQTEVGDGASGVGVYTDLWPAAVVAALSGADVQAALDYVVAFAASGDRTRESLSIANKIPDAPHELYFDDEDGISVLAVPFTRMRAGTISQLVVAVDVAENAVTGNDYRVEMWRRNTSTVIAFIDLLKGNIRTSKNLTTALAAGDELQPRMKLLAGSGRSVFRRVKLSLEITE